MASFCGKDFLALLPESIYTANDFDWMFQLEKESNVITLICRYIDSDDILGEDEIERYLEWEADNSFEGMEHPVPNKSSTIWGAIDDNKLIEAEIAASEMLLSCLPKHANTLKSLWEPSQEEARNSQHKSEQAQQLCQLAEGGCRTLSLRLLEAYTELVEDFKNSLILNYEMNCKMIPRLLVHFPLDDLKHDREQWSNAVRATLARETSVVSAEIKSGQPNSGFRFIIDGNETSYKRLLKLIAILVGKLLKVTVDSILRNFDHESILASKAAFKDLLQQIHTGQSNPFNDIETEPSKGFDLICYKKIEALLRKREKNKIVVPLMNKFTEECNSSLKKYCLKIGQLKEIADLVQEQKDLDLLTRVQCQLDTATVQRAEKLLQCFISSLPAYEDKVTAVLNHPENVMIKRERSASPSTTALASLQDAPKCTVDMLHNLFIQASNSIFKQEEILHSIRLLLAYFSKRRHIAKKIEIFVISGASKKPVVLDYNYFLSLQEQKKKYNKITEALSEAHSTVENIQKQNLGCCTLRLLWVPFMNGNAGRLEAIAAGDFSSYTTKVKQWGNRSKRDWSSVKKTKHINRTKF